VAYLQTKLESDDKRVRELKADVQGQMRHVDAAARDHRAPVALNQRGRVPKQYVSLSLSLSLSVSLSGTRPSSMECGKYCDLATDIGRENRYFWEMADSFESQMQQYNQHIEEVYQFLYDSAEEKKHTPEGMRQTGW
jgi:hypothetical protein